ncbi:MAG: hypothetical protein GY903_17515 [Fuerstiella sp.]|nr:hypothetical protein [Fuerstiella sp.]MCP4856283.1 hypothetical protein [Fuerstiella sp.]
MRGRVDAKDGAVGVWNRRSIGAFLTMDAMLTNDIEVCEAKADDEAGRFLLRIATLSLRGL